MAAIDLTTLSNVKAYAQTTGSGSAQDDPLISSLITPISQTILVILGRSILTTTHTDTFTGRGGRFLGNAYAPNYQPVLSIQSLSINGSPVPANPNPPNGAGFVFDAWDGIPPGMLQFVKLNGYGFGPYIPNNCSLVYTSGFQGIEEWPAAASVTPNSIYGLLVADNGVTYAATGIPLVKVPSAPAVGQYVAPNPLAAVSPTQAYQFNSADFGTNVNISYSFCPSVLEIAARRWVTEEYKYRARIGEESMSQGGIQTGTYKTEDTPAFVRRAIGLFQNTNYWG